MPAVVIIYEITVIKSGCVLEVMMTDKAAGLK